MTRGVSAARRQVRGPDVIVGMMGVVAAGAGALALALRRVRHRRPGADAAAVPSPAPRPADAAGPRPHSAEEDRLRLAIAPDGTRLWVYDEDLLWHEIVPWPESVHTDLRGSRDAAAG